MLSCVGYKYKTNGWNPQVIEPFPLIEVLCGFSKMKENDDIIGDRAGN
jgi:hypothetical protein